MSVARLAAMAARSACAAAMTFPVQAVSAAAGADLVGPGSYAAAAALQLLLDLPGLAHRDERGFRAAASTLILARALRTTCLAGAILLALIWTVSPAKDMPVSVGVRLAACLLIAGLTGAAIRVALRYYPTLFPFGTGWAGLMRQAAGFAPAWKR